MAISVQKFCTLLALLSVASCVQLKSNDSSGRDGVTQNTIDSVNPGYGRVIKVNPTVQSNGAVLDYDEDVAKFLDRNPVKITDDQFLVHHCRQGKVGAAENCFKVLNRQSETDLVSPSHRWAFPVHQQEFQQVQGYYHIVRLIDRMEADLETFYNNSRFFDSSIPSDLYSKLSYWYPGRTLVAYTNCGALDNSYYTPSTFSLCFGEVGKYPEQKFVFDPSVIYHETGHAFVQMFMNMRNVSASIFERVDLGIMQYDEASAINEGLADYFSFYMTDRTHMGEWALGLFYNQSRPMTESDPIHAPGIAPTVDSRLSYPDYVNYDPNDLKNKFEAVHYTGQITSHFLVAFTEELKNYCGMTQETAKQYVMSIVAQVLAERGDLSTLGADSHGEGYVNCDRSNASLWVNSVNPPNYRNFYQSFAKFALKTLNSSFACHSSIYPKDRLENLLDQYGLLMFTTYNESGNSASSEAAHLDTQVNPSNRLQTVLVSKNNIALDKREGAYDAYVFDNRTTIKKAIAAMKESGQITALSSIMDENAKWNSTPGNSQINAGEIVGVALNLFNKSNTNIAGVQVLANDWHHSENGKECMIDDYPSFDEGGAKCAPIAPENYLEVDPVCTIQTNVNGSSIFVSQEEFREMHQIPTTQCLDGKACFFRAIPGADQAVFAKIGNKKNWAETIMNGEKGSPEWNYSHFLFFEANPYIPPGTTFNCRLRVRFSNCKDCFYDEVKRDDFLDYEYAGDRPFKVINFTFTVTE